MILALLLILLVVSSVAAYHFLLDCCGGLAAIFCSIAFSLIPIILCVHFNDVSASKIKALDYAGIKPLTNEQIYEMSKKDLDKCLVIRTFDETYYFTEEAFD